MHHITRRLSPSLIVASVALFIALAGTAAAAVIIDSPDQLGDNVVTGRAIAPNAIVSSDVAQESLTDNDLADPQLKVRVSSNDGTNSATVLPGSDGSVKRVSEGTYNVTFDAFALNANGKTSTDTLLNNNCAFTATARDRAELVTISGPVAGAPNTAQVTTLSLQANSLFTASDSSFDITASC